jgi:CheY-like chemotaxis protein/anti-sigma regulatory factor (Ser/Thr protein kinase)
MLDTFLRRGGYEVVCATNGFVAMAKLREFGPAAFAAIITDHLMPELTGLGLLEKIRLIDPTLATIILTAAEERQVVTAALRGGAVDFLTKPFDAQILMRSTRSAVAETQRRRSIQAAQERLHTLAAIQQQLTPRLHTSTEGGGRSPSLRTRFYPIDEAGGDFSTVVASGNGQYTLALGDVSGHGVREGFLAAYFQGMVRGLFESGRSISEIAARCNTCLLNEWASDQAMDLPVSISAAFVRIDCGLGIAEVVNCGCPSPLFSSSGCSNTPARGGRPLGWFEPLQSMKAELQLGPSPSCYMWSDGLEDHAAAELISPLALAHRILEDGDQQSMDRLLASRKDDILVSRLSWSNTDETPQWLPLLSESYPGDQSGDIDSLQGWWKRSLQVALPALAKDILDRVLLCCREAVLNGLIHGCGASATMSCRLDISISADQGALLAVIDDDGLGFPPGAGRDDDEHVSLGLKLMSSLASSLSHSRQGARLTLRFDLPADPAASKPGGNAQVRP